MFWECSRGSCSWPAPSCTCSCTGGTGGLAGEGPAERGKQLAGMEGSGGSLEQGAPVRMRFRLAAELDDEPLHRLRLPNGEPGRHDFFALANFSGSLSKAALHPLEQK